MGQAKDQFFQKLEAKFATEGFVYKKSKNAFVKVENDVEFSFTIALDGRGGLTSLLWFHFDIEYLPLRKTLRKLANHSSTFFVKIHTKGTSNPQNYSLYDVEKTRLSSAKYNELSYDEKFPSAAIDTAVAYMWLGFEQDCRPAMQQYGSLKGIYEALKNYTFDEKISPIMVFPLMAHLFLRLVSEHFGENNTDKINAFLNNYHSRCIDEKDWTKVDLEQYEL
jgi:hypothetical protein